MCYLNLYIHVSACRKFMPSLFSFLAVHLVRGCNTPTCPTSRSKSIDYVLDMLNHGMRFYGISRAASRANRRACGWLDVLASVFGAILHITRIDCLLPVMACGAPINTPDSRVWSHTRLPLLAGSFFALPAWTFFVCGCRARRRPMRCCFHLLYCLPPCN